VDKVEDAAKVICSIFLKDRRFTVLTEEDRRKYNEYINVIFAAKVYSLKKMIKYERLGIIAILHGNS